MSFTPGMLKGSDAAALNKLLEDFVNLQTRFDALRMAEAELLPVLLTDYEPTSGSYSWEEQTFDEAGNRIHKENGLGGGSSWMPAFMPDNSDIGVTVTNPVQAFVRQFAANPNLGMIWEIVGIATTAGSDGSGGDGCCGGDTTTEYHPVTAPFTTTFEIRRPFGTGAATTSNIPCTFFGDFMKSRLAVDLPDWTHVLVCLNSVDIRDACTRLVGNNGLTYADGDEVRIPSGVASPRFVVVWVEVVNKGYSGPDLYEYKRVFMMRHTA